MADKNKPSLQRVAENTVKNFPMRRSPLAELLALKPARPGYPIIEDKAAQQKARDEYNAVTNADGIAATTGRRGDAVLMYTSQAVVNGYLSASPKNCFRGTHSNDLQILVSPPWRVKKKTALLRLDLVPLRVAPEAHAGNQADERDLPPQSHFTRYFSTGSFTEHEKIGRVTTGS